MEKIALCKKCGLTKPDCLKNSTEAMNGETPILISKSFYLLKYTLEFAKFEILKVLGEDIKDGGANENQR